MSIYGLSNSSTSITMVVGVSINEPFFGCKAADVRRNHAGCAVKTIANIRIGGLVAGGTAKTRFAEEVVGVLASIAEDSATMLAPSPISASISLGMFSSSRSMKSKSPEVDGSNQHLAIGLASSRSLLGMS
ncbi:hypothetical protein HAX54_052905 [Datura stramonium]|uniref:Uncharacterized protein n=1 Tax=Datura stramonium TaxID=4076 RepID=A0ABS8WP04_DATST|nr:hypothetical protein [Datura stramonium]